MKIYSCVTISIALAGFLLGGIPVTLSAAASDADMEATSATLLCGGAHGGTINRSSEWSFRNYDDSGSIQIDHITVYDRNGAVIYEAMPPTQSSNNVDPSDVGPHQSIIFTSEKLLGNTSPQRPLQFLLEWSSVSGKKVLSLDGYVVRTDNSVTGPADSFTLDCRTVDVKKGGKSKGS